MEYFGFLCAYERTHQMARSFALATLSQFFEPGNVVLIETHGGYICIASKTEENLSRYQQLEEVVFIERECRFGIRRVLADADGVLCIEESAASGLVQRMYRDDIAEQALFSWPGITASPEVTEILSNCEDKPVLPH